MKKTKNILFAFLALIVLALPMFALGCDSDQSSLEVFNSFKTEYYQGETIDLTDGVLKYTDKEGDVSYINVSSDMIINFNTTTPGNRKMVIIYNDETLEISYVVKEVIKMKDNRVYVENNSAHGTFGYFLLDRASSKLYIMSAGVLNLSETELKEYIINNGNGYVDSLPVTENIVGNKLITKFVSGEGTSFEEVVIITPGNDANTIQLSSASGTMSLTATIYEQA